MVAAAARDTAAAGAAPGTAKLQDVDSVYKIPDVDDIDNYLRGVIAEARFAAHTDMNMHAAYTHIHTCTAACTMLRTQTQIRTLRVRASPPFRRKTAHRARTRPLRTLSEAPRTHSGEKRTNVSVLSASRAISTKTGTFVRL
jgi:hypothetical protein